MEDLASAFGQQLHWVQPKTMARQFELRSKNGLLGSLRFETAFGTLATAELAGGLAPGGRWTFKRVGFLNARVTIRAAGENDNLAVYWPKFMGDGWLEFVDGSRFHWKSNNFWGTAWGFADAQEQLLFTLKSGSETPKLSDLLKTQVVVEIAAQAQPVAELPVLLMLGWYLMILHQEDSTVVATTVATMS